MHVHGKAQSIKTDENGRFSINIDANSQLHISKNNFVDARVQVTETSSALNITLVPTSVESVVVYASALHKNSLEMISPVSVLSGDELRNKAKPTLGETLKGLPGVNASYFGPVSSSPIIRGLDGPRVKITQNGLDSSDASRIGPDHAKSNDSLAAEQIEVLRGPATLLYGSGAIGGVVNVVDNRIPTDNIEQLTGAVEYSHDTVSNANTYAAKLETGHNNFNFHFDGTKRTGDDYQTPRFNLPEEEHEDHEGHDEEEHETATSVKNTFIDSQTVNFGTSYVGEHLTLGVSYGRIETDYGIPAHSHEHGHDHEHDHDEGEEEAVYARVEQDRWQGLMSYALHNNWIETINLRLGYTDYRHAEIEDGAIGTIFSNETTEARLNIEHKLGNWHGMAGYHFSESDYDADGEEAFTPASKTTTHALFILEEKQFGDVTLELGARIEDYNIDSNVGAAAHDHDHDHEDDHTDEHANEITPYSKSFTNLSASAGAIWQYTPGQSIALSLSHSERAPLSAELLSNGIHIATGTYELGLGYAIEDGEIHFEPENIKQETSTNIDFGFRRFSGDFGYTVNFFYNDIANFYYQQNTGLMFDEEHGLEATEPGHDDGMAVYQFVSKDAKLYGIECDAHYQLNSNAMVKLFGDSTTAKLADDEGYLPRIPANKLGSEFQYNISDWQFSLTGTHYFEQRDITAYETATDGYTLFDAQANYQLSVGPVDTQFYINVDNITDELGFVHSSFIKDQAPLPGRNFRIGLRGYF